MAQVLLVLGQGAHHISQTSGLGHGITLGSYMNDLHTRD